MRRLGRGRLSASLACLAAALICCGTGRVASAPQGPELSVASFGARGDGQNDDTAAIQAGVDALRSGATLRFPPGTYRIKSDQGIRLKDDVRLDLTDATLTGANVAGARCRLITVDGSRNVVISGGTLVGSRSGTPDWGVGIFASDASDLLIENVTLRDFFFDGILLTGNRGCQRVVVRGCVSENNRRTGLAIPSASDVSVESSVFRGSHGQSPQAGVNCEPGPGASVSKLRFSGSTFSANAGVGLYIHRALGVSVSEASVTGGVVDGNEQGIAVVGVDGVSIVGCRITGHRNRGRSAIALGEGTTRATITGNTLEGNFRGIISAGATDVAIRTNTLTGTGPPFTAGKGEDGDGIVCRGLRALLPGACVIANNVVRGSAGSGILTQLVSGVKVLDNSVEQAGQRGIYLSSTTDSDVTGNRVAEYSLEIPGRYPPIELASSSNDNLVANNVCRVGAGQQATIVVGPGCRGNRLFGNVTSPAVGDAGEPTQP